MEPDCKISRHLFGHVYAEADGHLWESDHKISVFNEQSLIVKRRGISVSVSQIIAMACLCEPLGRRKSVFYPSLLVRKAVCIELKNKRK